MATLTAQIQALAGTGTGSEMADWMTDGAREIINILPPKLKEKCSQITALTDANGIDMDGFGDVLHVTRETGNTTTIYAPCRKIPSMYGGMAADSSSLMYYGTTTDPVYWIESNSSDHSRLFIKPDPTASQDAKIYHIGYPSFTTGDTETWDIAQKTTITNFPDEAEYLVILYTAIKVLQNKMNETRGSLPSDISEPALSIMTSSLPVFQEPEGLVLPTPPDDADISVSFVKPVFNGVAPTYNPQVVAPDFADANTWLNTEEDSEMVAARMSVIQGQLQDYQAKLQNELNIFNVANVEYQSELQQYGTNIQNESERIQKEIQTYQAETGYDLSKYQAEVQSAVQKFQSDLSKNTTKFTNDSNNYSAELQKITQDNQSTLSKYGQDLQNFSAKIQKLSVDYQWYQGQQVKLQQDYNQGIQLLIGGGISPQKNKENK